MAVSNACATGHTSVPPIPQLRPSSSSSSSSSINFTKKLHNHSKRLHCCCTNPNNNKDNNNSCTASAAANWDWKRWTHHFDEIESAQYYASLIKIELEEAIEMQEFEEAAQLKTEFAEATSKDSIAEIMSQLQKAINDERYRDASRLCQNTGSGLVGWWVGYSKDSDDPFGTIIRITPDMGRFVGKSYSPRELVTASPGTPLFEIFVVKNADDTYTMQVVYLRQTKGSRTTTSSSSDFDVKLKENDFDKGDEQNLNIEGAAGEVIRRVINLLRDNIPDLKFKVMKLKVTKEEIEDGDSIKQLMDNNEGNSVSSDNTEEEDNDLDSNTEEDENNEEMKLLIREMLGNKEDSTTKDEYARVSAEILDTERNSFVLHIPKGSLGYNSKINIPTKVEVSETSPQSISELIPPDAAKAFLNSDKISPKVSRDVRGIIALAVKQEQKGSTLSEYTNFCRITTSKSDLDPFEGLFVGVFGPYGPEVVQLRRKYGNWDVKNAGESVNPEFFEYVEAVKLTGDLNVPAGQVTFRAKIGKESRSANRGMYPDELGVVASYKGQGRIAELGFRNPKWIEGKLLQLNGKGMGSHVKGADLGFIYVVPEQTVLVLFNRLKLPENP